MLGWIRRMTPRQLMFGWLGYWAVLGVTKLWHPLAVAWRVSRPDGKGSIAAGFENTTLTFKMVQDGTTVWSASASTTEIFLWLSVPPLLMWLGWVALRPRRAPDPALGLVTPAPALGAAQQPVETFGAKRERTPVPITPLP
jgi:hypothetical protein